MTKREWKVITLKDDMLVPQWPQIRCVGKVERTITRLMNGPPDIVSHDEGLYVSSRAMDADAFSSEVLKHWRIEGSLHGVLDGSAFFEDKCTSRTGNSIANLSLIRKLVLSIIVHDPVGRNCKARSFREKMEIYRENRSRLVGLLKMVRWKPKDLSL